MRYFINYQKIFEALQRNRNSSSALWQPSFSSKSLAAKTENTRTENRSSPQETYHIRVDKNGAWAEPRNAGLAELDRVGVFTGVCPAQGILSAVRTRPPRRCSSGQPHPQACVQCRRSLGSCRSALCARRGGESRPSELRRPVEL